MIWVVVTQMADFFGITMIDRDSSVGYRHVEINSSSAWSSEDLMAVGVKACLECFELILPCAIHQSYCSLQSAASRCSLQTLF